MSDGTRFSPFRVARRAARVLARQHDGPLTRRLERVVARFGLGQVPARKAPHAVVPTTCGFCSTGCGLSVHLREARGVNLTPNPTHPVNLGSACPKGWEALRVLDSPERATRPLVRGADGTLRPVSWSRVIDVVVEGFRHIAARHGPGALAFIGSGQITTEELASLGALAKFGLGFRHGDGNTRQCMATAVVAYKECFGFDAPPYTYADFEESDLIVLVGSNLAIAHPILWERVLRNRRGGRVVVIDPRRTETAAAAACHLAIRPKSDLALLWSVAHVLIANGWADARFIAEHTEGFDDLRRGVGQFPPERAAQETGLSTGEIVGLARAIHDADRASFWWTMGVNQSHQGVRTAQALIALALLTGNIGRPGTGANSITGQCNAMGSRLFSNTSSLLGGRDFANREHRGEVARVLGIDAARIATDAGRSYDEIIDGIRRGEIRGLWVIGTNPAHSWIDREGMEEALRRLDLLVVQDMYETTETSRLAHLVLPAAGWGEKDGTFINSERRIGRIRKVREAPGDALTDLEIIRRVGERAGCGDIVQNFATPETAFATIRRLSAGRPCDITGIPDPEFLEARGGMQWPYPAVGGDEARERRLFADGRFFTPSGRARFVFEEPAPASELPCPDYPLWLLTGRGTSAEWHTQTRTRQSSVLRQLHPSELTVEIHPEEIAAYGLATDSLARVESRRGSVTARVVASPGMPRGCVFLPMHWPETNRLTHPSFDPRSRQPAYKAGAVRVRAATAGRARPRRRKP